MVSELFALGNALASAGSNVTAGAAVRRSGPLGVLLVSAPVTVAVALAVALAGDWPNTALPLTWGLLAGVVGGVGLALSYRAFALGRVAVVVPVTACAATVVQVGAGWLIDGRPPAGTMLGAAACLAAVAVISGQTGEPDAGARPLRAVAFAMTAGVTFAGFTILVAQGVDQAGTWTLAAARFGVLVVVLAMAAWQSVPLPAGRATLGLAAASGLLDVTANLFLLAALSTASLARVAAIVAMAPVVVAVLAIIFLGERLQWRQVAGLALATMGVLLVVLT